MNKLEFSALNSLFHTDWNPGKGDFVKENSMKDGEIMESRLRKHKITVWLLSIIIVISFAASIAFLSV